MSFKFVLYAEGSDSTYRLQAIDGSALLKHSIAIDDLLRK
jgi:hypothetical protein